MLFASATYFHRKSGEAERRDLRFYGPFVEMFFDIPAGSANLPHCHPDSSLVILDTQTDVFNPLAKPSSCERSASQICRTTKGLQARSRTTPAMTIGRYYWELSGHRLRGKLKKSRPPSVPGFPTSQLLPATAYVVLLKENYIQLIEAATLDRKSGEADLSRRAVEGSAVLRTFPGNVFATPTLDMPRQRPLRCRKP